MAKQTINLGTAPAGSDGDTVRSAFTKVNGNFDELYLCSLAKLTKNIAGGAGTTALTATEALNGVIDLTGAITGNRVVTVAATPVQSWIVRNSTTGGDFSVTFSTATGTGVVVPRGVSLLLYTDGVNVLDPVAIALADTSAVAAGRIEFFARSTAPAGYLKANGGAVSRAAFANLFAAIGTTFGAGDGSTTFNLPDLRGEFLRALDDGRGIDAGRALGSAQGGQVPSHQHKIPMASDAGAMYSVQDAGGVSPLYGTLAESQVPARVVAQGALQSYPTLQVATTSGTVLQTSAETRPRNVALLACIKF
ncbi:tail fiber protein [Cupriavidus nantongensis]